MSELRSAVRALLADPLLESGHGGLDAVRRSRSELSSFFLDELGYRLDASRTGVVRLAKLPGAAHEPRGLESRSGRRFDGRRYALCCLVLAAAESAGERATLAGLFEEVASRAANVEGLAFDSEQAVDRRAFVQAVQAATDLGVLELAQGDEERFARNEAGGDALYRIDRERLALLPTAPQPPSLVGGPSELSLEAYPDTDEGRVRRRRHRVMRALVEEPVVHFDDLTPEELDYLRSQRPRIERVLAEHVGLSLEVRAEGLVAVDESGELTDVRWPDYGSAETAALRCCDELVRRARAGAPPWPLEEVRLFVAALAADYPGYWRRSAERPEEAARLTDEALAILRRLRLIIIVDDTVAARPAAARFAAVTPTFPEVPAAPEVPPAPEVGASDPARSVAVPGDIAAPQPGAGPDPGASGTPLRVTIERSR